MSMARYADNSRLVFDLEINNGDEAAYYLSCGFHVVALGANPKLCERAQTWFRTAIDERRQKILNVAILEKSSAAADANTLKVVDDLSGMSYKSYFTNTLSGLWRPSLNWKMMRVS